MPALRDPLRAVPGVLPRVRPAPAGHRRAHSRAGYRMAPSRPVVSGRLDLSGSRCADHRVAGRGPGDPGQPRQRRIGDQDASGDESDRPRRDRNASVLASASVGDINASHRARADHRRAAASTAAFEPADRVARGTERLDDRARIRAAKRRSRGGCE